MLALAVLAILALIALCIAIHLALWLETPSKEAEERWRSGVILWARKRP